MKEKSKYGTASNPIEPKSNANCLTQEMIEGLAEEEIGLVDNLSSRWVNEFNLPEGYIFKDENGNIINATKIVLEKKEYPKTYDDFVSLVKRMREAQITYWDSINISKPDRPSPMSIVYLVKAQDLEREVDEYLKNME